MLKTQSLRINQRTREEYYQHTVQGGAILLTLKTMWICNGRANASLIPKTVKA